MPLPRRRNRKLNRSRPATVFEIPLLERGGRYHHCLDRESQDSRRSIDLSSITRSQPKASANADDEGQPHSIDARLEMRASYLIRLDGSATGLKSKSIKLQGCSSFTSSQCRSLTRRNTSYQIRPAETPNSPLSTTAHEVRGGTIKPGPT